MDQDKDNTKIDISEPLLSDKDVDQIESKRKKIPTKRSNYYFNANCISSLLFWWVGHYVSRGQKKPFEQEMHGELKDKDAAQCIFQAFHKAWKKNEHKKSSLFRTIYHVQRGLFLKGFLFVVMGSLLVLVGPILLNQIISFVNNPEGDYRKGIALIAGIALTKSLATLLQAQGMLKLTLLGNRTLIGVTALIYSKCLTFSILQSDDHSEGSITNNIQIDSITFNYFGYLISGLITIPAQLIVAFTLIGHFVGIIPLLAGIATLVFMLAINAFASRKFTKYQEVVMKKRDARMKATTEMINGIKVIKMSGMEDEFFEKVTHKRDTELNLLKKQYYPYIFTIFGSNATPVLITAVLFLVYILQGNELTAEVAFPIISVLAILQGPILGLPFVVAYLLKAKVSVGRIQKFLEAPNINDSYLIRNDDANDNNAIIVHHGYFYWRKLENQPSIVDKGSIQIPSNTQISTTQNSINNEKTLDGFEGERSLVKEDLVSEYTLKNINLRIKRGEFVAIIGDVGSGKSSLIQALIGEIMVDETKDSKVYINGKIAYVSQKAWILNKTVRDNIIFNHEYNEERYQEVIDLACLREDLKVLAKGDQTEIGEKGVNLSGGQKARISLARAIYCNRDIYLLDDPLAALDVHVGTSIMQNCFSSHLKSKTRVLVTHNLDMLKYVERVMIMRKGEIIGDGTYEEIREHPYYQALREKFKQKRQEEAEEGEDEEDVDIKGLEAGDVYLNDLTLLKRMSSKKKSLRRKSQPAEAPQMSKVEKISPDTDNKDLEKLMLAEDRERGQVGTAVYKAGIDFYGGWCFVTYLLILMSIWLGLSLAANFWVSYWTTSQATAADSNQLFYVAVYSGLTLVFSLFTLIRIWSLIAKSISSARKIHAKMIRSILRAPLNTFFDRVPAGRILNRFSKDINIVDSWLYESVSNYFVATFLVLGDIIIAFYGGSWYILPLVVLFFWFALTVQRRFIRVSSEVTRLEAITKSPIISHVGQTLSGLNSIRAYGVVEKFMCDQIDLQNANLKNNYLMGLLNGWLSTRLVFAAMTLVIPVIALTMFLRGNLTAGLAGIIVTYSLRFDDDIRSFLNYKGITEQRCVSVERCVAFMKIEPEAAVKTTAVVPGFDPKVWPSQGKVQFIDFSLRYRPNLPLVLKNINLTICPGEKIGVVGRTGSGKSTLLLSILRTIEAAGGKILIDDVDISALGLYDLRKKITIIAQDAMLYEGTLRENLDIFKEHSDAEMLELLEKISLKDRFPNALEFEIKADGSNLSEGEKQLVCIARAILRKNKIVLIDEATSNIDLDTEELIQKTTFERFKECTTITIAHRLSTIINSDRILVMGDGEILEFDTPQNLLDNPKSEFASLWNQALKEKTF